MSEEVLFEGMNADAIAEKIYLAVVKEVPDMDLYSLYIGVKKCGEKVAGLLLCDTKIGDRPKLFGPLPKTDT